MHEGFWKLGLLLFALGVWWHREIAWVGVSLLTVAAILDRDWVKRVTWGNWPLMLAFIWMAYVFIASIIFALIYTEYAYVMLNDGLRLIYLGGFVLVAYALNKNPDYMWPMLVLAFLGFFLGRLEFAPRIINSGLDWWQRRHALGFPTAIPMAQYAFAIMLGMLLFYPRISRTGKWLYTILWLCGMLILVLSILKSQSRSVWILMPVFLVAAMLLMWRMKIMTSVHFRFLILSFSIVLAVLLEIDYASVVTERLSKESQTLERVIEGEWQNIKGVDDEGRTDSIRLRIENINYGVSKWLEQPWFGWGPGGTKMLIDCCAPDYFAKNNDFHSAYIETLVRMGGIGSFLFVVMNVSVIVAAISAYRCGRLPADILLFIVLALLLHYAVAVANYRMLNHDWRFYWFLFAGLAVAFSIRNGSPGSQHGASAQGADISG